MSHQARAVGEGPARNRARLPRHPIRHAAALTRAHAWRRLYAVARARRLLTGLLLVLAAMAAIVFFGLTVAPLREALSLASQHPLLPLLACAMVCGVLSLRRRRRFRHAFARSWLAALPLPGTPDRAQFMAVLRPGVLAVLGLALWLRLAAGSAAYDSFLLALVGCASVASLVGWRLGASDARSRPPARPRLPRDLTAEPVGLQALGRWPLRQALLNANPGLHARTLGALLVAAPMGTPPRYAIAAIIVVAIVIFWLELARGLLQSIPAATCALCSLPLRQADFVRALCLRAAVLTVLAGAVGSVSLLAVNVAAEIAMLFALAGIFFVSAATLVAFAFAAGSSRRD